MWPLSRMGLVWGILERHMVTCVEKYPIIKPVPTSNLLQGLLSPLGSESLSESLHREHYISSCGVLLLLLFLRIWPCEACLLLCVLELSAEEAPSLMVVPLRQDGLLRVFVLSCFQV